nr:hypothetical protein Iba_chr03dCG3290 [Ipomoea batatas]
MLCSCSPFVIDLETDLGPPMRVDFAPFGFGRGSWPDLLFWGLRWCSAQPRASGTMVVLDSALWLVDLEQHPM